MKRSVLAVLCLTAAACNPPAVDPNATFTIEGKLAGVDGTPASYTKVRIYKADTRWSGEHYLRSLEDIHADTIFTTETNGAGEFSIALKGSEVNTEDGTGAAYLAAVHHADGDPLSYMATGTPWFSFTNANPTWTVGTLALWNGGSAAELDGYLVFDWANSPAPNDAAAGFPYSLVIQDGESEETHWKVTTYGHDAYVPRAAFESGDAAAFFLHGYSRVNSQLYQHRTNLKTVADWTESIPRTNYADNGTLSTDLGSISSNNAALDEDVTTRLTFSGQPRSIYLDLGAGGRTFKELLVYDLGVSSFASARVSIAVSLAESSTPPEDFTTIETFDGSAGFPDSTYLSVVGDGSGGARWIRISVSELGGSGAAPYVTHVGEIKVLN